MTIIAGFMMMAALAADVPAIVMRDINYAAEMCNGFQTEPFSYDEKYTDSMDLNEDGMPDYIVDGRGFRCGPKTRSLYRSQAGAPIYVYLSNSKTGEYEKIYGAYAYEYRVVQNYGEPPYLDLWEKGAVGYSKNMVRRQWDGWDMVVIDREMGVEVPRDLWKEF